MNSEEGKQDNAAKSSQADPRRAAAEAFADRFLEEHKEELDEVIDGFAEAVRESTRAELGRSPDRIQLADELVDRFSKRIWESAEPSINILDQMVRILITLSGGALVLTVSLAQLFASRPSFVSVAWAWLVPVSWILFGLTLALGPLAFRRSGMSRTFLSEVNRRLNDLFAEIAQLKRDQNFYQMLHKTVFKQLYAAMDRPDKALAQHAKIVNVMYGSFLVGLAALVIFSIRNLPF